MDTCQEWTEKVTEHLEGAQTWSDWAQFRLHVLLCPPCRAYLQQVEVSLDALGKVAEEPIPDDVREGLLRRYREWQQELTAD